ncbi:radical SAM protein [Alkalihalobacillus sp. LMS39]|uniref:7-carboxy-7-deazaguanine synthase QueE n=1 Tax=Alkalihalobacillus sp. LMS39 TaxID=2924032 RepID=UPI001FB562AE|nr:radical SAM protein [Alkalihalobacillus sp. LMS39]UOE93490.1 radical SAM protein [Alkalihalobacillus sp. LMS39]
MIEQLPSKEEYWDWELPMVEIFETVEGEGSAAGFPTVFVRVFGCNLRCTWCDTTYSYAPAKPEFQATVGEIINRISQFHSKRICFTGGEPLLHGKKSFALLEAMAKLDTIVDIHVETNGAIHLQPYANYRKQNEHWSKVRFVMDYKLQGSGEESKMELENFNYFSEKDEIKFVIANDDDFTRAKEIISSYHKKGQVLFSPVWETMPPKILVEKVLDAKLSDVKVSLQLHKIIWDPELRGV